MNPRPSSLALSSLRGLAVAAATVTLAFIAAAIAPVAGAAGPDAAGSPVAGRTAPATGLPGTAQRAESGAAASAESASGCPVLLRRTLNSLQNGKPQSLCQYRGKVLVIVNTASYCGYTHQYEGLEALYRQYKDRGLVVLGFPSNDYGAQEPGSNKEIAEFCRTTYGVEFPMFEKAAGTRLDATPVYTELIARTGKTPKWNFHKYVVDRSGSRIRSFPSDIEPGDPAFIGTIESLLRERPAGPNG